MAHRRRIALADLLVASGFKQRDLWDLRPLGLFPFTPDHAHIRGRRGSASDYAFEALDYLRRLQEPQQQFPRKSDEWFWRMWLDPGDWPIDMRSWILAYLDRLIAKTSRAKAAGAVLQPEAERQLPGAGRVRNPKCRQAAWDWMVAWALGNERPDLYSAAPEEVSELSFFDLLLKIMGPPFCGSFGTSGEGTTRTNFGARRPLLACPLSAPRCSRA